MSSFFESASQKARREEQEKQGRVRSFEQSLDRIAGKQAQVEAECTRLWNKAKAELTSGNKMAANMTLKHYKVKKSEADRLSRFHFLVKSRFDSMNSGVEMQNVMAALNELAGSCGIDVDQFQEDMDNSEAVMDDARDMERIMEKASQRESLRLERDFEAGNAIDDDPLLKALEESVAAPAAAAASPLKESAAAPAPQKITEENVDSALEDLLKMS